MSSGPVSRKFFEKFDIVRDENIDEIRAREQENLEAKTALCEKAEALAGEEDSITKRDVIEQLYNEWE